MARDRGSGSDGDDGTTSRRISFTSDSSSVLSNKRNNIRNKYNNDSDNDSEIHINTNSVQKKMSSFFSSKHSLTFLSMSVLFGILVCLTESTWGHVGLTFPPARKFDLDFLDKIRTKPPCGMPKNGKK